MKEVKCIYKPSVCLLWSLVHSVELLRSCGINILVVVSDIPEFCLDYKPLYHLRHSNLQQASCFITFRVTSRPHRWMKTSSTQSKRCDLHPRWLHRETKDSTLLLSRVVYMLRVSTTKMCFFRVTMILAGDFGSLILIRIILKESILVNLKNIEDPLPGFMIRIKYNSSLVKSLKKTMSFRQTELLSSTDKNVWGIRAKEI